MKITRNQWFGLITFILLAAAACLVTVEPWKKSTKDLGTSLVNLPPAEISIRWNDLATGYPMTLHTDTIISHMGFDLGYNEQFEQASWVTYVLTRDEAESENVDRTENFRPDTSIRTGSAQLSDYRGSGFDRGHLAPAGDMRWNRTAMSESFLLSNMSPQSPSFNRGIWKKLEDQVRVWAIEKDSLYIITGPVLEPVDSLIGESRVAVPRYYFKVLVDLSPPDHSFIAFLLPNDRSDNDLYHYVVSVDSLESFTGYDFFAFAPDQQIIDWLEKNVDLTSWN